MSELFGYQLLIAQVASQFTTAAWLQYDIAFRKAASQEPAQPWDKVDASLWSICFTNQARTVCFKCRDSGHLASQCDTSLFGQWATAIPVNRESLQAREFTSSPSRKPTRASCAETTKWNVQPRQRSMQVCPHL